MKKTHTHPKQNPTFSLNRRIHTHTHKLGYHLYASTCQINIFVDSLHNHIKVFGKV